MKRMGDRMAQAREQMQAQMANLPPEQRAMMEKMMGRAAAPTPPQPARAAYGQRAVAGAGSRFDSQAAQGVQ